MEMCKSLMLSMNLGVPESSALQRSKTGSFVPLEELYKDVRNSECGEPPNRQDVCSMS